MFQKILPRLISSSRQTRAFSTTRRRMVKSGLPAKTKSSKLSDNEFWKGVMVGSMMETVAFSVALGVGVVYVMANNVTFTST